MTWAQSSEVVHQPGPARTLGQGLLAGVVRHLGHFVGPYPGVEPASGGRHPGRADQLPQVDPLPSSGVWTRSTSAGEGCPAGLGTNLETMHHANTCDCGRNEIQECTEYISESGEESKQWQWAAAEAAVQVYININRLWVGLNLAVGFKTNHRMVVLGFAVKLQNSLEL